MAKYRKILVAIDGSLSSMHALRESFKFAEAEKCWMTVVSVIPPYLGDLDTTSVGNVIASMRKPCEDALAEAARLAEEAKIMVRTTCEEGEMHERIVDLSDAENYDLIVMGRRGHHNLERALVGSVTARVIGYSNKDVLVVPKDATVGWQKILIATDGSKFSEAATEKAIDFAVSYGGELIILSVVDVPAEFYGESPEAWDNLVVKARTYLDKAKQKAEASGIRVQAFIRETETWQAIIDMAAETKADTIIMGSHGRTGLKRLLMGSVTEKVIGHAPCPVLVVKG
ncbi:MAG: universal stress protein [Nitrospirae bacterium]|nr:universal stress protein [Nitrospirota bacterium]